jgi:hypothetical protein
MEFDFASLSIGVRRGRASGTDGGPSVGLSSRATRRCRAVTCTSTSMTERGSVRWPRLHTARMFATAGAAASARTGDLGPPDEPAPSRLLPTAALKPDDQALLGQLLEAFGKSSAVAQVRARVVAQLVQQQLALVLPRRQRPERNGACLICRCAGSLAAGHRHPPLTEYRPASVPLYVSAVH